MNPQQQWKDLTTARVLSAEQLQHEKQNAAARAIGVIGFSSGFEKCDRPNAESTCRETLRRLFLQRKESHPETPLWCISGATNVGVPRIAYEQAGELGVTRIGVTAAAAREFELAELEYLTIFGEQFGDESEIMLALCDEIWLIGGGNQSERETRRAVQLGVPVTIVQGFGGAADSFQPDELPAEYLKV